MHNSQKNLNIYFIKRNRVEERSETLMAMSCMKLTRVYIRKAYRIFWRWLVLCK